jgi:tripartite-type tricarboxylate transporter receptor subunit TctC
MFAPAGTPAAIVTKLNKEVNLALKNPEIYGYFSSRGFSVGGSGVAEYKAFIEAEAKKWAGIIKDSGATVN